jgi:hypothetical protein
VILLWGLEADGPLAAVRAQLDSAGADTVLVDQRAVLASRLDDGHLWLRDTELPLAAVTAAYLRPYDSASLPVVAHGGPGARHHAAEFDARLWAWAEATDALVVNRPSAMAHNSSKPYQARHARAVGFAVPDTLLTTDPAAVHAFRAEHADVVYKSISSIRSVVTRLRARDLDRLADVTSCPTQFQTYVPGVDHRVHVVGDAVHCCCIESTADDYRYAARAGAFVERTEVNLPAEVADRCRALAVSEGLHVAGVDLRLTPAGEWYCFEVNPSPAFTFYDGRGSPIARKIAVLLMQRAVSRGHQLSGRPPS